MKFISFIAFLCWLGGGLALHYHFSAWILGLYGFLSIVYLATWLVLRRGFSLAE